MSVVTIPGKIWHIVYIELTLTADAGDLMQIVDLH